MVQQDDTFPSRSCSAPSKLPGTWDHWDHSWRRPRASKKPAVRPPCFSTAQPKGGKDEIETCWAHELYIVAHVTVVSKTPYIVVISEGELKFPQMTPQLWVGVGILPRLLNIKRTCIIYWPACIMMMFFPIYWEAKERWNPQYHRVGLKSKDGWQIPRSLQLHMHFHFVLLNFQAGEVLRFTACTMYTLKH